MSDIFTQSTGHAFTTIFGRNLVGELRSFVHRPYLVVTMADLWPRFAHHFDDGLAGVHLVDTLEHNALIQAVDTLPAAQCVIGLGGGQAVDVAKFVAWRRRLPLFQVPTAMTVDAPFGHRAAVREAGRVRYVGWAVPEAVYVDFDVIRSAPPLLNRSGVGDILCFHTALYDWQLAHRRGRTEPQWPYDPRLAGEAQAVLDAVWARLPAIRAVDDDGIRTLMTALRWAGAAYHNAGWNPRPIEGVEHFFFYTLETQTRKRFIHGQPVCLGVLLGAILQDNRVAAVQDAIRQVGVDIRPAAMGIDWDDVAHAAESMAAYVRRSGLWYTVASVRPVTTEVLDHLKAAVAATVPDP
jgi:glycerol dehydrogenase-like iron-containing ADH family enzyme